MPSPSATLATLRPELGSYQEFDLLANQAGFIGYKCLPVIEVAKQAGTFGKIPVEQLLQNHNVDRAPGSAYSRTEWTFTSDSWNCSERGLEGVLDDNEAEMYVEFFDGEQVTVDRLVHGVLLEAEKRVAAKLFDATTFASQTTGITNEWDKNHKTDAVPMADVEAAVQAMWAKTGVWANAIAFNRHVFRNLRNLDTVLDRIAASGAGDKIKPADINTAMLAACFDLDHVFVAGGAKNSAIEGQDTVFADVWSSEYALIFRVPTTNDIREPALGRCFHWGADGSQVLGLTESYRDERVRGEVFRVRHQVDEKFIHTECAWLLSNVTTI